MVLKNDRGRSTRQHIVEIATRLFASDGYEGTSIEAVLRSSDVSRGALYHHFSSKEALFTAVLEATEVLIAETVHAAARDAEDPVSALRAGCRAWLALACDPVVERIVLIDAPSVVGWQTWREIDSRHGLGLLKNSLGMTAAAGLIKQGDVDLYAHILLATLIELALLITRADDKARMMKTGTEAIDTVIAGLIPNPIGPQAG